MGLLSRNKPITGDCGAVASLSPRTGLQKQRKKGSPHGLSLHIRHPFGNIIFPLEILSKCSLAGARVPTSLSLFSAPRHRLYILYTQTRKSISTRGVNKREEKKRSGALCATAVSSDTKNSGREREREKGRRYGIDEGKKADTCARLTLRLRAAAVASSEH